MEKLPSGRSSDRIETMNLPINNLRYVTTDGLEAPVDRNSPDCPFYGPGRTSHGQRVANSSIRGLRWETLGAQRELKFNGGIIAVLDPKSGKIVVKVSTNDLPEPNNAVAVNPDATIDHQIIVPPQVKRTIQQYPGKAPVEREYPVEGVSEVLVEDQRIILGLDFAQEWVERRTYDVAKQLWGEQVLQYRK
jgi:hypothetical protein